MSQLLAPSGNKCNEFGSAAAAAPPRNLMQLSAPTGDKCDEFGTVARHSP